MLRKVRNTYRLLQAVGQNLIEWRKGVWFRLKDLPLAALRPAHLGNVSKNSFTCLVFGKLSYTALNHGPICFFFLPDIVLHFALFPKDVIGIIFYSLLQNRRI